MNLLREKLRARGHHKAMMGGDGGDTTHTQDTRYNYTDSRSVTSTDSHDNYSQDNRGYSNSGNTTTTVTSLDPGAIAAGRELGLRAIDQNSVNTAALFAASDRLFSRGAQILDANMQLTASLSQTAANAYDGATSQATGNRTMLLVGLAVVGVVAVMAFGGK